MKTQQRQLFRQLGRVVPGLQVLLTVLLLFVVGTSPAWGYDDPGGGTYNFWYTYWTEGDLNKTNFFKTRKSFSLVDKNYYWEFEFRCVPNPDYPNATETFGQVDILTADDKWHKIGEWHRQLYDVNIDYFRVTDETWGYVRFVSSKNLWEADRNIVMQFLPKERCFTDGVKRFRVRFNDLKLVYYIHEKVDVSEVYFEKDMDTSLGDNLPLPKLSVEFGNDRNLYFTAMNVVDDRNNPKCLGKSYHTQIHYPISARSNGINVTGLNVSNLEVIKEHDGLTDLFGNSSIRSYEDASPAYFYPIMIRYSGTATYYIGTSPSFNAGEVSPEEQLTLKRPEEVVIVDPFTRPTSIHVEFDKWMKHNVIRWNANKQASAYDFSSRLYTRPCRFEGKWYVIRWDDGQSPDTYTVVKELDGPTTELSVTDEDIEYDKKYHYRVIFLPYLLVDEYKDQLTSGLLNNPNRLLANFWLERQVDTKLEMPIRLWQDMAYIDAVRLKWDYCVKPTGQSWVIEYSPQDKNQWRVLDNSLMVDQNVSEALFDADGSPCDYFDYRVKTTYMNRDFYSNVITGHLPAGSYISEVTASTGTEEKTVVVKWKVMRPDINNDIYYHVLRRAIGTEEWTLLTDAIHGKEAEYTFIDDRPLAGSYYEYTVAAYGSACPEQVDQIVKLGEIITPGFSQARGTITGHIAFGSGTAVANVRVNLVKSSADESSDQPQFLSRYIEGEGKGLQWTADSAKYANTLNGSQPLTLQLWAKPQPTSGTTMALLRLAGALEIGVKSTESESHLYAVDNSQGGTAVKEFPNLKFDPLDFTHVTAVYQGGQWTFYVGTDTLLTATMPAAATNWNAIAASSGTNATMPTLSLAGNNRIGGAYEGYADDIRLWSRALSNEEIASNYTRIQGGTENGLILYWPLDEGLSVKRYAFDVARQDGIYQLNHPTVGVNAQPSAIVPQRLALYGLTDHEGDYIIKGIPFQQGGTNYKLTPELGIHDFSPATRSMFVSPTSLTANNIDFEDVSSFPMEGYIYYAGTNIPAEGIQLYVDGELQTKDGKMVQTDDHGHYMLSVPIGQHFVEAKLDGHTMVSGGRFPTEGRFNFDRAMTYNFADSTLVNFVGRVGGGERNDTLAVGFGASKNNIGQATITLKLNNESLLFNTDATQIRTWQSDTTAVRSTTQTGTAGEAKYIEILTDPQTGEFSALLPPLKYITKNIELVTKDKNPNVEFTALPEIDLTNVRKELSDSLKMPTERGDSTWQYYKYNTKMVKTYFAKPEVAMWQVNGDGAFGEQVMKNYPISSTDSIDINDIWTRQEDGSVKYTYDFPVFARKKQYRFGLHGYEAYTNYDTGTAVTDTIPMNGLVLTIANEMSDEQSVVSRVIDPSVTDLKAGDIYQLKRNQIRLDSLGRNEVTFTTGAPNITAPYTRLFSVSFERDKRTYTGPAVNGIVLGELTNGNNFVTDGPDHVDMVLRDPPGSKGKTTWKTGTSWTKIESRTDGAYFDEGASVDLIWGAELETAVGLGVAIISANKATTTMNIGEKGSFSWLWKDESTYVYTSAEGISTSTGEKYVGADGDVFIGKSHNYIIGTCRKLGFHREASGIVLGLKEAVGINDSIKTDFMYSALEIEKTMIPKILDTRNALLEYMDETSAKSYQNTSDKDVYLTWLTPDDPNYGTDGTYVWKPGTGGRSQNMVLYYNESARLWRERLAENERDKIEAFSGTNYYKENRSFDGGAAYSYSERRDTTKTSTYNSNKKVGVAYNLKTELSLNAAATFGTNFNFNTEVGYIQSNVVGDSLDNVKSYSEFDYDLVDGNPGTDFTVDIYRSPRGWSDIFLLRGGQSYNPYEGLEHAKYYEPDKKHVISYGTEQMEQPNIQVSTDGGISAKQATLTDIPAGGTGQFTLHLTNQSTSNQSFEFIYKLMVQEKANPYGLAVFMDGVAADGRSVLVPAGETVKKTITVRQTDQSVLDYEGIEIWFLSQYQPIIINDKCVLNVHFKPSSSPIELAITEPVLNTESKGGQLQMKLTGFNRQFKNLKNIGIQYRFAGSTQWTNLHTWVTNKADSTSASFSLLPPEGDLRWSEDMSSNLSYPEGNYEFRAFTTTPYGTEQVQVYSDVVKVIKDMTRPRNLFTPSPANGILNYGDQLAIEFNEDIVPGYVADNNVIVTAKLNSQQVNHEVALQLLPFSQSRTVNPVFLQGDFSIDFWLNWHEGGTVMHLGADTSIFALSIRDDGYAVVSIAGNQFVSHRPMPKDTWTFVALAFKASTMTFDMLALAEDQNIDLFQNQPVAAQAVQAVSYSDDNYLYLGGILADIHSLSLYNIYRDVHEAGAAKNQTKDNYVYGLANYWPMDEGHGYIAADSRHTHDFQVLQTWTLENVNYSLRLDNTDGVMADITRINTAPGDSYAIELWYYIDAPGNDGEVVFETALPATGEDQQEQSAKLRLRRDRQENLYLDYGTKTQLLTNIDEVANNAPWCHLALNVVRGQAASFYVSGQRVAVIAETDVPPFTGSRLIVGKGKDLQQVDELRIWHAALSEQRLQQNIYNAIDTADVYSRGLVAYYPFEQTGKENGITTKVPTLKNMMGDDELMVGEHMLVKDAPPVKNAPEETQLIASPVASERKVVINLTGAGISPRDIEGTTLNVTVDRVHDLNGNTSLPIRWTAYVQQNTLKWTRDSVNVIKMYGDSYTFDVDIENKGGQTEYYTLYNMPQWLSLVDSERSDDVQPQKTKTLRFEVNPLVAVGNYDVTIGLQGNNEILEPLRIVMKVRGEKPQWAVDPTMYDHNMTIIGQVYLSGILMENPESMVAAFIGTECRGVASPVKQRGAAYVTLSIYGNDTGTKDHNKAVSFRIWDATKGVAYTDAQIAVDGLPIDVTFSQDLMIGNFDHPAIWTKSNNVEQLIPLHENWNWIAFGVEPKSTYLDHIFGDYAEWKLLIKNRTNFSDYNGAEWNGTLTPRVNEMYKLKIERTLTTQQASPNSLLALSGRQLSSDEMPVTLRNGWNWIAYTPLTTMTLEEALAGANPQKGDIVKSQTGVAIYGFYGWEGNLLALEGGHGYMYYSTDNTEKSFVYPSATASVAAARRAGTDPLSIFTPVDPTRYPNNMTMVIRMVDGSAVIDTTEVAAFVGDECRGATRASSNGLYYLVIAGEGSGQPITLRTCLDDAIVTIDETLTFVSDDNIGTSWEPYVIDLQNLSNGIREVDASATDNDDDWWTLQGFKIGRKPTQPGVYIHHGQKVTIKWKKEKE